jgi:outer membrane lipoprotein-sorting protein
MPLDHFAFRGAAACAAALFISSISSAAAASVPDLPPTVAELVSKNIEARGGAAAIKSLHSLRRSGKLLVNQGQFELTFMQMYKMPGAVREEAGLQGLTQIQAFDGKEGWQINPFQGRKDPERLSSDDIKSLAEDVADFGSALIDADAKGNVIEYAGTEDVDGTLAYKLKLTRKNGEVKYVFLDSDHFLEIRTLSQRTEHGAQVETETDMGDYEKIGGVFLPMSIETGLRRSQDKQKIVFDKAEPNVALDDALFAFPAAKPTAK